MNILENIKKEIENTQVVILAGGSAKRMGKIDKAKALLELNGKTLLDIEIELFEKCGFKNFVFLLGNYSDQIIDYLEKNGYFDRLNISISVDPILQNWGKGKAIKYAYINKKIERKRFIISFPDDIKLDNLLPIKLLLQHLSIRERDKNILGTVVLANGIEFPFGVATIDENGKITSFIEKPLLNKLVNIGMGIYEPEVLDLVEKEIDIDIPKAIEFEEVILPLLASKRQLYSLIIPSDVWIPVNDLKAYEKARKIFENIYKL